MTPDQLREEATNLAILFAKCGAASSAKAQIIKNDYDAWQSSNFIGKDAAEAYQEQARYIAHVFGGTEKLMHHLFETTSPAMIAKRTVIHKPKHAIENFDWNEQIIA